MGRLVKQRHANHPTTVLHKLCEISGGVEIGDSINNVLPVTCRSASIMGMARQVFLPEGFPESVSGDYLEYQAGIFSKKNVAVEFQ